MWKVIIDILVNFSEKVGSRNSVTVLVIAKHWELETKNIKYNLGDSKKM
jgi:hypothetical protein